jgi:hypothetical protein
MEALADLALVLMTTPLAEVENGLIFSVKGDIIGTHAPGTLSLGSKGASIRNHATQ